MRCPFCRGDNDDGVDVCFKCGRGLFALTQGHVVASRYEILSTLGQGGMGTVYKAHDRELDETVALKVLRGDLTKHPEITKRFLSEIKLARRVRHKNVCGIHEYGQDGNLRYIAMELISGVDLKRVVRERGLLTQTEAFDISIQVAEGLQAIHDEGIVHRDLKTPNIMRDTRGVVRLMDFGIAKQWASETATALTATGQIVGTPEYMSPEQVRGEKIDSRSDIYALGIVTFELFTGKVPFRGETPMLTLLRHLQDPPPLEGPAAAKLPKALALVLGKALAKDAVDRYESAREMGDALRDAQRTSVARTAPEFLPKPVRTANASWLQPETAGALSPPTTIVPTEVPTLPPKPVSARLDVTPPATTLPAGTAKPDKPTPRAATVQEATLPRASGDRLEASHPARVAASSPLTPTTFPKTPIVLEPAIQRVDASMAQTKRPRPITGARWPAVTLAVGGVLTVCTFALLIRQWAPPAGGASGALIPTPSPIPPQAVNSAAGAGPGETSSASPTGVPSEPVSALKRAPLPSPTPTVVQAPGLTGQGKAAYAPATSASTGATLQAHPETPKPTTEPTPTAGTPPLVLRGEAAPPSPSPALVTPSQAAEAGLAIPNERSIPGVEAQGSLVLKVKPWAEVTIDGRLMGKNLPPKILLTPGSHTLVLMHPDFEAFRRILTVRSGETSALTVDLKDEAVRRKR